MWVRVESLDGSGGFTGRLQNQPRYIPDLAADDLVAFRAEHIINTEHDGDDNLVERYQPRCFVTQRVLQGEAKVGYLYREDPEAEDDSGWSITAGDETDDYMNDARNVAYVSLGAVLNCDDSILPLLEAPVGSAFVRQADTGAFRAVEED